MKTVFITGCSEGGIGEELAIQFKAKGLRVIASARNVASMEALTKLDIETLQLDVTNNESIAAAKEQVAKMTDGKLDILVNNAGVAYPYSAADLSMDKVRDLFAVNVFGVMAMTKEFVNLLIASGNGCVVNMGSLAGVMPVPFGSAYNASKAALHSFSDTLRVELAPFNVRVLTVIAGNIQSKLSKPWHTLPAGSIYEPIRKEYQYRRVDHFQDGAFPREAVVASIVSETLKSEPKAWLWVGKNAFLSWFISTFFSRTGFDSMMSKIFFLDTLAQRLKIKNLKKD